MAVGKLWARTTRTDRFLILLLSFAALLSLIWSVGRASGHQVIIYEEEQIVFVGPLNQDRAFSAVGPLGETRIEISEGRARVTSSPCPHKVCIAMGKVWRNGDLLACVPNRVVVRIEGAEQKAYDLISR